MVCSSLALSNEAGIYGLMVGESWLWWEQLSFLRDCSRSDEMCADEDHQLIVFERPFVLASSRGALGSGWQGEKGMIDEVYMPGGVRSVRCCREESRWGRREGGHGKARQD